MHYRSLPLLKLCVRSLLETASDIVKEIIVVHNAGEWEAEDTIRELFPTVRQRVYRENRGYAFGVNRGLELATAPYVLILNPDIIVRPHAVRRLVQCLDRHPEIGMAGPKLINFNGTTQISYSRFYTPFIVLLRRTILGRLPVFVPLLEWFQFEGVVSDRVAASVDWLMGSAMMVRNEAIKKAGPMDERFFMYFEDVDWCRRFWLAGYKVVYYPRAAMHHYHQRASHSRGLADIFVNPFTRVHIRSAFHYFRKYGVRYPHHLVQPLTASLKRPKRPFGRSLPVRGKRALSYGN